MKYLELSRYILHECNAALSMNDTFCTHYRIALVVSVASYDAYGHKNNGMNYEKLLAY